MKVQTQLNFPKNNKLENVKTIKVLQFASQVIALSPPNLFNYSGLVGCYAVYAILICLLLTALCVHAIYHRFYYLYSKIIITGAILDATSLIGITLTNIIGVLCAIIFRRRSFVQIAKNLKDIESIFNSKFNVQFVLNARNLTLQFIFLLVFVIIHMVYDHSHRIPQDGPKPGIIFIYFLHDLNIFMESFIVMQVQLYSTCIKQMFQFLNKQLISSFQHSSNIQTVEKNRFTNVNMKFFLKIYDRLCDVIELVNTSYGIQLIFITFFIIVCLIRSLNLLMKYALGMELVTGGNSQAILLLESWNSIIHILNGVLVAVSCEQAAQEVGNTSAISYKILLQFPSLSKTQVEEVTKNELLLLAEHLSREKVKFSACGFFDIDHTMLYMIFGSIAAYLVIVLQFN